MKLINLPEMHVFHFASDKNQKKYYLVEKYISEDKKHYQYDWHRIYRDGRTNIQGIAEFSKDFLACTDVVDHGHLYDWMKEHHPIRYKREGWANSEQYRTDK